MKTVFLVTALAALSVAGAASAEAPRPEARVAAVSTVGLDLGSERGVRKLDLRILQAASALCGTPSSADARGRIAFKQCRDEARATAAARRSRAIEIARSENAVIAANR